ncbi:hypothetical protein B0A48_12625 [Cryoendolithus antarcticus]|uniref:Uncharacterized protein n=1 Tax=Cryoendolithus antarcticus TaxID=1507870 RepID=A0A1V8SR93_9PEZI|nr:hypothetical protein B0A48_12625 [Cryoendolithus antarcticus]
MHVRSVFGLAALAGLTAASPLEVRSTSPKFCSAINSTVTRLKAQSSATPFCSSFLRIPKSTITSTAQTIAVTSVTVTSPTTATVTGAVVSIIVTSISTQTNTIPTVQSETSYSTVTTTLIPSSTSISATTTILTECTPYSSQTLGARAATISTSTSSVATPTALKSWAASAISSACSCLSIPTQTVSATVTSVTTSAITVTAFAANVVTVTPTSTSTLVQEVTATDYVVTTTRQTIISTTTITPSPVTNTVFSSVTAPACAAACTALPDLEGFRFRDFNRYFAGNQVTLNPNNPRNDGMHGPYSATFPGSSKDCEAITACRVFAHDQYGSSLEIHYRLSTGLWECTVYWQGRGLTNTDAYSVYDADVGRSYRYSEPGNNN